VKVVVIADCGVHKLQQTAAYSSWLPLAIVLHLFRDASLASVPIFITYSLTYSCPDTTMKPTLELAGTLRVVGL
jgi:hypothetical protein